MKILVERTTSHIDATISNLSVDGKLLCYVCEDVLRGKDEPKVFGKTAIPAGEYRVIVNKSTRFSAMKKRDIYLPLILDLPGKTTYFGTQKFDDCGIRIHTGNRPEDTEGCLLVGMAVNPDGRGVSSSAVAFAKLFPLIQQALARQEQVLLTIKNPC